MMKNGAKQMRTGEEMKMKEFETLQDKYVMVAGAGRSGVASTGLLIRNGAKVMLYDQNEKLDVEKLLSGFSAPEKVSVVTGELKKTDLKDVDLMVISPGISPKLPFVDLVREAGIPIWGEIELASFYNKGRIAAITGTNGKTTTTTLTGEIFRHVAPESLIVGNIGLPFTQFADATNEKTLVAAEISSFQLETVYTFHPHVAVITNLTPDHLDRHGSFENYAALKFEIAKNMTKDDVMILNYDDPEVRARKDLVKNARVVWFSHETEPEEGAFVRDGKIIVRDQGEEHEILLVKSIRILGEHNLENVLASVLLTYYMDIPKEIIRDAVMNFMGVEHRIEFVRNVNGVEYYNDSKGTNPDAAIKALKAMKTTTLLIGGGYDKGNTFDEWVECFKGKVRYLVLIGATDPIITRCCKDHGFHEIIHVETLKDAVIFCYNHAMPEDAVLLSPACASWDMFKDFEERGNLFKQYVNELEEKEFE